MGDLVVCVVTSMVWIFFYYCLMDSDVWWRGLISIALLNSKISPQYPCGKLAICIGPLPDRCQRVFCTCDPCHSRVNLGCCMSHFECLYFQKRGADTLPWGKKNSSSAQLTLGFDLLHLNSTIFLQARNDGLLYTFTPPYLKTDSSLSFSDREGNILCHGLLLPSINRVLHFLISARCFILFKETEWLPAKKHMDLGLGLNVT